jgi:hypothetical protein
MTIYMFKSESVYEAAKTSGELATATTMRCQASSYPEP